VRLESELTRIYGEHRAVVDGRRLNANDVDDILGSSTDLPERRAVWEASKSVGREVDAPLRELVRLRNEAARALGHRDHYAMSLALEELDEDWLFDLFDRLDSGLDAAWTAEKAAIDVVQRERLGLADGEPVRAWHLVDPFGQEAPSPAEDPLRDIEATIDIEAAVRRYFADLGYDVDAVLARSDLYPREGKDQHAFQITTDRQGDVRHPLQRRADALLARHDAARARPRGLRPGPRP
jgi:peptidyl-dipeptidase A